MNYFVSPPHTIVSQRSRTVVIDSENEKMAMDEVKTDNVSPTSILTDTDRKKKFCQDIIKQESINIKKHRRIIGQTRETGNIEYTRPKTKTNKCKIHHYTQTNTNNVNKTWARLQAPTGGKDEPNIVFMRNNTELRTQHNRATQRNNRGNPGTREG